MKLRLILITCCSVIIVACSSTLSLPNFEPSSVHRATFKAGATEYLGQYNPDSDTDSFLGIPFAQAPIGNLRWTPPQSPRQISKMVMADRFAAACMQGPHLYNWYQNVIKSFSGNASDFSQAEVSEDCLYLNIWRPHKRPVNNSGPMPVLVFIHGGSNKGGWSYEPNYIGAHLAAKDAVVVTIAYRLGVFGYFAHPELEHANFGLLDQIAALSWIKEHISKLGGDPNNVTIAGESSGASNISYLLVSPLASGLFKRAIHQSAGWAMRNTNEKIDSDKLGLLLSKHNFPDKENAGIDDLRSLSTKSVFTSADAIYAGHFFDPVIDGHSVTTPLAKAMLSKQLNAQDLMIGSNANEALMYIDQAQTPLDWLTEHTPHADIAEVTELFDENISDLQKLDQLATSYGYTCPSLRLAQLFSEREYNRSWFYYFSRIRQGPLAAKMGAYHGAELPYIFNTHDKWLPTNSDDIALGESMMDYWIQFAHDGNPNSPRQPVWLPFTNSSEAALQLDTKIVSMLHPSLDTCRALLNNR